MGAAAGNLSFAAEDLTTLQSTLHEQEADGASGKELLTTMSREFERLTSGLEEEGAPAPEPAPAPAPEPTPEPIPTSAPPPEQALADSAGAAPATDSSEQEIAALARARTRVSVLMRQISNEAFKTFVVAVDGHDPSELAYAAAVAMMKSRDGLIVLHVFDSSASDDEMPDALRPHRIKDRFDLDLSTSMSASRFQLKWLDKQGESLKSFLLKAVNDLARKREDLPLKPSYFISGFSEKPKGPRLKTLSVLAAGQFQLPNIIIKQPVVKGKKRIFVVAVKDTMSMMPYEAALGLIKSGDLLIILTVYEESNYEATAFHEDESDHVIKKFRAEFEKRLDSDGLTIGGSRVVTLVDEPSVPVFEQIVRFVKQENADFVVINPHLVSDAPGNNCTRVISDCPCNIVVCKRG